MNSMMQEPDQARRRPKIAHSGYFMLVDERPGHPRPLRLERHPQARRAARHAPLPRAHAARSLSTSSAAVILAPAARVDIVQLVLGIAILYWGAEWLIRGSASVARAFGVKPLVVGLTVVAYGTSAPELAVATKTALTHNQPIALGTVIGSCAANISLILGLTALISPPTIDGRIIRREVPILLGSAIAVPLLLRNGVLSRLEGAMLIGCAVVFTIVTLTVSARLDPDDELLDGREPTQGRAQARGERRRARRHAAARARRAAPRDDDRDRPGAARRRLASCSSAAAAGSPARSG